MKIRNADEERKKKAQQSVNNLNAVLNNAKEKYGSIDKRRILKEQMHNGKVYRKAHEYGKQKDID